MLRAVLVLRLRAPRMIARTRGTLSRGTRRTATLAIPRSTIAFHPEIHDRAVLHNSIQGWDLEEEEAVEDSPLHTHKVKVPRVKATPHPLSLTLDFQGDLHSSTQATPTQQDPLVGTPTIEQDTPATPQDQATQDSLVGPPTLLGPPHHKDPLQIIHQPPNPSSNTRRALAMGPPLDPLTQAPWPPRAPG